MKISLALATYNGERFITEQLNSILRQTRIPDEVVIIDDRSTDNTAKIISEYITTHNLDWNFEISGENSGYIGNFRKCLKKCHGDVIFLCDQDDIWLNNKIETITKRFESDNNCLAVNSSFVAVDADGKSLESFQSNSHRTSNNKLILYYLENGSFSKVSLQTVLTYNISPGCTCAFRKQVVDSYLEADQSVLPHDWELNILAAAQDGLFFLNTPLIRYRIHGGNAIGLSSGRGDYALKMRGNDCGRLKVYEMQKAQADIIAKNRYKCGSQASRFFDSFAKFCNNRYRILYRYRLFPCFCNFFLYHNIVKVSTVHFRGLIGDIIYVLKRKLNGERK